MKPLCDYFRQCNGCDIQHLDYPAQLNNKKLNLQKKIGYDNIAIFPSKEYFYRNRLDALFHKKGVGLRGTGTIIQIAKCVICNEGINKIIAILNKLEYDASTVKSAILRSTSYENAICFNMDKDSTKIKGTIEKIKNLPVENISVSYGDETFPIKGNEIIKERLLDHEFFHHSAGFFQNNTEIAEKMQTYVNLLFKKYSTKEAHLLDLYGGVGTFGIINSNLFKKTTIVENFKESIDCAKMNIEKNAKDKTEALVLDSSRIKRLKFLSPLFVVTDPPRSGMDQKTINAIKELNPEVIIYISCNIDKLEKDIKKFSKYKLESAALFDMFPQTNHVEAIVELKRA